MKKILHRTKYVLCTVVIFVSAFLLINNDLSGDEGACGNVLIIRNGKLERPKMEILENLKIGDKVFYGDRLKTEKSAVAVLRLPSIGRFVIGPSTEVDLGKDTKNFKTTMKRGAIWIESDLKKDNSMSVTTGLATSGVRGTKFSVIYDENGVDVCTCRGEVVVILNDGRTIQALTGNYVAIKSDGIAPEKSQRATSILRRVGSGKEERFDWCFSCHVVGSKGELKKDLY